jgi:hypothetical protein
MHPGVLGVQITIHTFQLQLQLSFTLFQCGAVGAIAWWFVQLHLPTDGVEVVRVVWRW